MTIGGCTLIVGHCYISAANHIFINNEIMRFQGETAEGIKIGNNVWISGDVMITYGVTVSDGCVIGAGSIVIKNLPPNTICHSIPCKVIKEREKPYWVSKNS